MDFKVEGTPRPLPSGVELTAYRIVQEALTNTRKHGGPDAGASVRLVYFDDGLGLLVEDDGKGAPHELYEEGGADGAGHGLIGMRERVGMVGGTLDAGPRPGGGFRISAAAAAQTGALTTDARPRTRVRTPVRPRPSATRIDRTRARHDGKDPMTIRVMLVDDQVLLRTGFRMVLARPAGHGGRRGGGRRRRGPAGAARHGRRTSC